jgi:erythritol transport system ATP-binding protein
VAHSSTASIDVPWIIERMVGRNPASLYTRRDHSIGEVLLRATDLTIPRVGGGYVLNHVSFELRAGEILGLYGLMGAGRSDLLDCLAGARPEATGEIWLDGKRVVGSAVADRIAAGFVLVPEDRQRDGLVQTMSVGDNMLLASLRKYVDRLLLVKKKERAAVTRYVNDLHIRASSPDQSITSLSGGNQQKVVVAKGLLTAPRVLLLDEPTRGIDVGAKSEMFEIMSRLAEQGLGVLFVSSELKEVLAMSDRILVLSKGSITAEFARGSATEATLVAASAVGHGPAGEHE